MISVYFAFPALSSWSLGVLFVLRPVGDVGFDVEVDAVPILVIAYHMLVVVTLLDRPRSASFAPYGARDRRFICTNNCGDGSDHRPLVSFNVGRRGSPMGRPYPYRAPTGERFVRPFMQHEEAAHMIRHYHVRPLPDPRAPRSTKTSELCRNV